MDPEDREPVELPVEMYEGDEASVAPVFTGERMEAGEPEWTAPEQIDVLAKRSEDGPRVAAFLGLLALGVVIAILLLQTD